MADIPSLSRLKRALADRYLIVRPLGSGGMATVYLARDRKHERNVGLKVLRPELAAVLGAERFLAEIRTTAALDHPHILTLIDSGESDGFLWYVLPYVRGESLRDRLNKEGPLPLENALAITRQVAAALEYAHRRGVIHRDIKPENILLFEGEAMLTDFGIALAIGPAAITRLTEIGMSLGTPQYMSPEQASGARGLDARSDLYSLGAVAYEMLAGEPPHSGPTAQAVIAKLLTDRPTPLRTLRDAVPEPVAAAVEKALSKVPADRFASASQFASALDSSRGAPPREFVAVPQLRGRRLVPAIATALVALSVVLWSFTNSRRSGAPSESTSIAVMPFANFSGDLANDYFGEGLAEEMTGALAKGGLHVIGRSSTRQLASRGLDSREVARDLGVTTVLEGNWQRAGERVRISVTLTSGADGSVMWNQRYDRRLEDIFAIQDEIARSVASQLRATLASGAADSLVKQETTDPEAHSRYLQGLYLWNRRTAQSIRQAIALFEQAVSRDTNYGRAYAGIALGKAVLPWYDDVNNNDLAEEARKAAGRALAIDSTLTEAWAVRGLVNTAQRNFAEASRDLTHAIALDSTLATNRFWHGLHLVQVGRFDEADREFARAQQLEPVSLVIRVGPIVMLTNQRRHVEAEAIARKLLLDDPTFALARWHLGAVLADAGRFEESIATLSNIVELPGVRPSEAHSTLAYALASAGRIAEARRVIDTLGAPSASDMPPSALLASALMVLGEREAALAVLQSAVEQHDPFIGLAGRAARLDPLWSDSSARALLRATQAP